MPDPATPKPPVPDSPITGHPQITEQINALIAEAGQDTDTLTGKLIREAVHTSLKLITDGADDGEIKLVSRSLKELRYALRVFRPYRERRKISVFGSARTPADHPAYIAGYDFSKQIAQAGWMTITGAGGGIMEAGNAGAGADHSFGVAIRLPFETTANPTIENDGKLITFRYFFTRKLMFVSQSDAIALLPGGFGTQDEGFEVLTLVQTGKSVTVPIVFLDEPGGTYWQAFDQLIKEQMLGNALISPEDLSLYFVTDSVEEAVAHTLQFYKNYHSQRYVRDQLVLRLLRPLSAVAVDQLNEEFADIIQTGRIEQRSPLPEEGDQHPDLPRLAFHFTRLSFGRLRQLIDRLNELAD